jgi:hypothetical protein
MFLLYGIQIPKGDNMKVIKAEGKNGFKISLTATNFRDGDYEKLERILPLCAEALGSDEFQDFMANFSYDLKVCSGRWWWKKCRTDVIENFKDSYINVNGVRKYMEKEEVYHHLMTAEEVLSEDGEDKEADIFMELDRRSSRNVLGYTYSNTTKQWIYNSFFKNGDDWDIAGNIVHEWVHKMGYGHAYKRTATRQYSVPYAVGYFVRDYVEKALTQQEKEN